MIAEGNLFCNIEYIASVHHRSRCLTKLIQAFKLTRRCKMKYYAIFLFVVVFSCTVFAEKPPVSCPEAQKAALSYAKQIWGGYKVGSGITFVDPSDNPAVYMFLIYLNKINHLPDEIIKQNVAKARLERQAGEEILRQGLENGNFALAAEGWSKIEQGWKEMRGEENFATVFISATDPVHPGIDMYKGFPLNFVALPDAEDKVKSQKNVSSVKLKRYIYNGPFDLYAEFETDAEPALVHLKTGEYFDVKTDASTLKNKPGLYNTGRTPFTPPEILVEDPAPPFQVKIGGVPEYQTIYSRGCAPAASGCILGYHDSRYPLLIDGGDKNHEGHRDPNGEGYLYTIWDELGPAMYYTPGTGTGVPWIDDGIKAVCNDSVWENLYNFTTGFFYGTASSLYSNIRNQIKYNKPAVYITEYPLYHDGSGNTGLHAVTLVGYGCLLPPWVDPDPLLKPHPGIKSTEPYEYVYICHDNTTTTGTDVYLWWSLYLSNCYLITVRPGYPTASNYFPETNVCRNYPNPFNPSTEIFYSLSKTSPVSLKIFNLQGQCIKEFQEGIRAAGQYSLKWDGTNNSGQAVPAGLYIYYLYTSDKTIKRKMTLIR